MARWSDLAEWVGPTPNQSGAMTEVRGLVVHTASGYYKGTISWQKNASADVSSHFIVAGPRDAPYGVADGKIAQMVDTGVVAWTQRDGNGHWLSVECSGFGGTNDGKTGDKLSPGQIEAIAQLLVRAHREYGVPLQLAHDPTGKGLGYHSMGAENGYNWGHLYCPGEPIKAQLPAVLARAIEIVGGDDVSTQDVVDGLNQTVDFRSSGVAAAAKAVGMTGKSTRELIEYLFKAVVLDAPARDAALSARLDAILAAASDDGDVTVQMDDAARAELKAIRDALSASAHAAADKLDADA